MQFKESGLRYCGLLLLSPSSMQLSTKLKQLHFSSTAKTDQRKKRLRVVFFLVRDVLLCFYCIKSKCFSPTECSASIIQCNPAISDFKGPNNFICFCQYGILKEMTQRNHNLAFVVGAILSPVKRGFTVFVYGD